MAIIIVSSRLNPSQVTAAMTIALRNPMTAAFIMENLANTSLPSQTREMLKRRYELPQLCLILWSYLPERDWRWAPQSG
jgi:hypothetical protein